MALLQHLPLVWHQKCRQRLLSQWPWGWHSTLQFSKPGMAQYLMPPAIFYKGPKFLHKSIIPGWRQDGSLWHEVKESRKHTHGEEQIVWKPQRNLQPATPGATARYIAFEAEDESIWPPSFEPTGKDEYFKNWKKSFKCEAVEISSVHVGSGENGFTHERLWLNNHEKGWNRGKQSTW